MINNLLENLIFNKTMYIHTYMIIHDTYIYTHTHIYISIYKNPLKFWFEIFFIQKIINN